MKRTSAPDRGSIRRLRGPRNRRATRKGAGWSEVAQTTMELLRALRPHVVLENRRGPRDCARRFRAMTVTRADCGGHRIRARCSAHAAAPKIPMRCPLPRASARSMARMPVMIGPVMCSRSERAFGRLVQAILRGGAEFPAAIERTAENRPRPVRSGPGPTATRRASALGGRPCDHGQLHAVDFLQRHREHMSIRKPMTCVRMRRPEDVVTCRSLPPQRPVPGSDQDADHLGNLPGPRQKLVFRTCAMWGRKSSVSGLVMRLSARHGAQARR